MKKKEVFVKEISYINDENIRKDAEFLMDNLPDYFYRVATSSSGKYHPRYSNGEGGLIRHTKSAVRIAKELLDNPLIGSKYSSREKDFAILALLVHDGLKSGKTESKYHKTEHPLYAAEYVKENKGSLSLDDKDIEILAKTISSHMGPWNKDFDGNVVLPVPNGKLENFVHMCDYLASRKFLNVDFDEENNLLD